MTSALSQPVREWWRPPAPVVTVVVSPSEARSRSSELAFRALLAFMFVLLIAPQTIWPPLGVLHLAALSALIAIGSHLAAASRPGGRVLGAQRALRWALLLAGWALLTAPLSAWPGGTVSLLFDLYFKSLVVFWLLGVVVDTEPRLKRMLTWLTLLSVWISTNAIREYLAGAFVAGGAAGAPRIKGYEAPLTGNPNDLALVLSMLLPLAVALAAVEPRRWWRLALWGIAALDVAGVVLSFSRTGFLTLGVLALVGVSKLPSRRRWACVMAVVALALVSLPLLPNGYLQHMGTIADIERDPTGSAQHRWSDGITALKLVLSHPIIGAGAGMSDLALNAARGASWVQVHNVYLQYATDLGLPGLALFLALFATCSSGVRRVVRSTAGVPGAARLHAIACGVQAMLIAFAVAGFFHPAAYHFHFYNAAGLAGAVVAAWENEHA